VVCTYRIYSITLIHFEKVFKRGLFINKKEYMYRLCVKLYEFVFSSGSYEIALNNVIPWKQSIDLDDKYRLSRLFTSLR